MASRPDTSEMLSRFPGPVTLYPSRKKWLLVCAGGALFAIGGVWMVRSGEWMGWLPLIFFSLVALVAAVAMLPGAGALTLGREGFEITNLFRRHPTRWQDALRFATADTTRHPALGSLRRYQSEREAHCEDQRRDRRAQCGVARYLWSFARRSRAPDDAMARARPGVRLAALNLAFQPGRTFSSFQCS